MTVWICLVMMGREADISACLKLLDSAHQMGLPVTATERAGLALTPEIRANRKKIDAIYARIQAHHISMETTQGLEKLTSQLGWNTIVEVCDQLAISGHPLDAYNPSRAPRYPIQSRLKGLIKIEVLAAEAKIASGDVTGAADHLTNARRLMDNQVWYEDLIGIMCVRAAQDIYIASVERIQSEYPQQFEQLPKILFIPFGKLDLRELVKSDFRQSLNMDFGPVTPTKATINADPVSLRAIQIKLRNWLLLYPQVKDVRNWTDIQIGYVAVEPLFESMTVNGAPYTFVPSYMAKSSNLDQDDLRRTTRILALNRNSQPPSN